MAFEIHPDWLRLASYTRTGHARSNATPSVEVAAASAKPDLQCAADQWISAAGANGQRRGDQPGQRFIRGPWVRAGYAFIDVCCVVANACLALWGRFSMGGLHRFLDSGELTISFRRPAPSYEGFLLLYVVLVLVFCESHDLYRTPRTRTAREESIEVAKAVCMATFLLVALMYFLGDTIISRVVVLDVLLLNIATLGLWRYAKRRIVIRRVEQGIGSRNVVIIGAGIVGQALARELDDNKHLGYRFKGFLDENHNNDPRMLGKIEDLARVARSYFLDEIFISIPSERELVKRIAVEARQNRLDVKVVPELYDGLGWHAPILHVGNFPVMDLHWQPTPTFGFFVKRVCDVLFSGCALIVLSPVLAGLAIWIAFDSPGPAVYCSKRMGRKGRVFPCYKLRTMVANADDLKDSLRHQNERQGPFFKIEGDPRVTRLGRRLRKYSLDELPQLWNVFTGDMSLVGPRPHPLDDFERYSLEHLRRLDVKPGLTGLWQVTARRDPSFETNLALDLEYIDQWSLALDIKILLKTVPEILHASGT